MNHFPAEMTKDTVDIYASHNTSCPGVWDSNWYTSPGGLPEHCQSAERIFLDLSALRRLLVVMVSIQPISSCGAGSHNCKVFIIFEFWLFINKVQDNEAHCVLSGGCLSVSD